MLKLRITELNWMTHSLFIEILMILDRVFRNCGVRNSEVLLYFYSNYFLSLNAVVLSIGLNLEVIYNTAGQN